jgi:hypothetical protein
MYTRETYCIERHSLSPIIIICRCHCRFRGEILDIRSEHLVTEVHFCPCTFLIKMIVSLSAREKHVFDSLLLLLIRLAEKHIT